MKSRLGPRRAELEARLVMLRSHQEIIGVAVLRRFRQPADHPLGDVGILSSRCIRAQLCELGEGFGITCADILESNDEKAPPERVCIMRIQSRGR